MSTTPLFSSRESLYVSTRGIVHRFLRRFRKKKSRAAKGSRRRDTVKTLATGRNVRPEKYRPGANVVAPRQTILNSIYAGRFDCSRNLITVAEEDFAGWQRAEHESLTLILAVDVSRSTHPYLGVFAEILKSLTAYFNRNKDRIGLVSLQGSQAKILNHPTHNYRIVERNLVGLEIHGETPLADGLAKALEMAKLEKSRKPGSRSLVILLSDCYPEPLTCRHGDVFDEPAYRNTINIASIYRRNKVFLLVVNPAFRASPQEKLPGERLSELIVRVSGGRLIKLVGSGDHPVGEKAPRPTRREVETILTGIEAAFSQLRLGARSQSEMVSPPGYPGGG